MLDKAMLWSKRYGFWVLATFHFFGVVMMAYYDLDLFASFTPLNLLLSASLVLLAAQKEDLSKLISFFLLSFGIGYGVEVLGTQTGFPFGDYRYLENLGIQFWEVPPIIGINWFLLAYASALWTRQLISNSTFQIFIAAALMVGLDFFIEPLCEILGFWAWENKVAPWENYLGWYGVSLLVQWIYTRIGIQSDNLLARQYFVLVTLFFIMLNLLL